MTWYVAYYPLPSVKAAEKRKAARRTFTRPGCDEVINLFALAIRLDLDANRVGELVSAYPSFGSNVTGMLEELAK